MKKKMEMIKRKEMYIVYDYNVNTWYDINKNSRFIWKKGIEWYDGWISNDMLILLVQERLWDLISSGDQLTCTDIR